MLPVCHHDPQQYLTSFIAANLYSRTKKWSWRPLRYGKWQMHVWSIWSNEIKRVPFPHLHSFVCDSCLKKANKTRKENKYAARSKWSKWQTGGAHLPSSSSGCQSVSPLQSLSCFFSVFSLSLFSFGAVTDTYSFPKRTSHKYNTILSCEEQTQWTFSHLQICLNLWFGALFSKSFSSFPRGSLV